MAEIMDQLVNKQSIWYRLGFVDYTDNVIYGVLGGNEKRGSIIGFVGNLSKFKKIVDWETGEVKDMPPGYVPEDDPVLKFLFEQYGKRWVRIPILRSLRPMKIYRVTVRETARQGTALDERLEATSVTRYGLYYEILRPTKHRDIDTGDNRRFSVNSFSTLHVVDAKPAFTVYQDNFLETASDIIATYLSGAILSQGYQTYKDRSKVKDTKNKLSVVELNELNERLKLIGLEVQAVSLSDPELAAKFQDAIDLRVVKEELAEGIRATGKAEADNVEAKLTAEANGRRKINEADATRISAMASAFTRANPDIDRTDAIEMVQERLTADANAKAVGDLKGTYAPSIPGGQSNFRVVDINRNRQTLPDDEPADGESDELQRDDDSVGTGGNPTTGGVGIAVAVPPTEVPPASDTVPTNRRKRRKDRR